MLKSILNNWFDPSKDWSLIKVEKDTVERTYVLEKATGDLYLPNLEKSELCRIAMKATWIFFFTTLYAVGVMGYSLAALALSIHHPSQYSEKIWRICLVPLYALAMMGASLYTIACPLEGRKWISSVERSWHQNTPLSKHYPYYRQLFHPLKVAEKLASGHILFLAPCMQKRGNIKDKIGNECKFKLIGGKK